MTACDWQVQRAKASDLAIRFAGVGERLPLVIRRSNGTFVI
jgi:hypothetical protein